MQVKRIHIRNKAGIEIHGIPAGETMRVRATPDGKAPESLEHRKRIADGTFEIVRAERPASKPAAKKEG